MPPRNNKQNFLLIALLLLRLTCFDNLFYPNLFDLFHRHETHVHDITETSFMQFADKLFECVWPFCGVGI